MCGLCSCTLPATKNKQLLPQGRQGWAAYLVAPFPSTLLSLCLIPLLPMCWQLGDLLCGSMRAVPGR